MAKRRRKRKPPPKKLPKDTVVTDVVESDVEAVTAASVVPSDVMTETLVDDQLEEAAEDLNASGVSVTQPLLNAAQSESSTCTETLSHRYEASEGSSDSDVAVVMPQRAKRRRILPGTVPMAAMVYSNKVNSSLKLLSDGPNTLAQMEKELQMKQGCDDLENEAIVEAQPTEVKMPTYDLSDSDAENEKSDAPCQRIRDSSPSPPPTPKVPVRKGRMNKKFREIEARLDLGTVLSPSHNSISDDNDVIMVGSSPAPELTIKVRRRGEIFRINIRPTDPLQKLVESMASRLEVDSSQILLLHGDRELDTQDTPKALNLSVADIIECVVLSASREQGSGDQTDEQICLKVQGKDRQSHLSVTIGKNEPLQSLMDQYRTAMGLSKNVCFMFEGKKLKGRSTAEELGLEGDDIIEAWV